MSYREEIPYHQITQTFIYKYFENQFMRLHVTSMGTLQNTPFKTLYNIPHITLFNTQFDTHFNTLFHALKPEIAIDDSS